MGQRGQVQTLPERNARFAPGGPWRRGGFAQLAGLCPCPTGGRMRRGWRLAHPVSPSLPPSSADADLGSSMLSGGVAQSWPQGQRGNSLWRGRGEWEPGHCLCSLLLASPQGTSSGPLPLSPGPALLTVLIPGSEPP